MLVRAENPDPAIFNDRFFIRTDRLEIECFAAGEEKAPPILLLHGWPDCALTWRHLAGVLVHDGWRVIAPSLRGFGRTSFVDSDTPRSGQLSALAQDALDLLDAMQIDTAVPVIGHDWGARAAYILSCLWPRRVSACVAMSVGWGTNRPDQALSIAQASNYWYHWFMHTVHGREAVRNRRRELTRFLWRQWSPSWQFTQTEYDETAAFFDNPDWADVVVHSYTHRWAGAQGDPAYAALESLLEAAPPIEVPTLMIHGGDDRVNDPSSSENREALFSGPYRRIVVPGCGHFPQREFPGEIAAVTREFLARLS